MSELEAQIAGERIGLALAVILKIVIPLTGLGAIIYLLWRIAERREESTKPATIDCPACYEPVEVGTKFCPKCGAQLLSECPKCGASVKFGAAFCQECGEAIQSEE